jgi:hypothetical protein
MIDFSKITKTLDGFDCHYFGTRESFGRQVHCFAVFHPLLGTAEVQCDANGKRLKFENKEWVESTATNYQIVKPMRKVEVVGWLCFKHVPTEPEDPVAVHLWDCEPSEKQIEAAKYFKVEKHVWTVEVPE